MSLVKKYSDTEPVVISLLAQDKAIQAFNLLLEGKSIIEVKHELSIPSAQVKLLETRFIEIRDMIERIIRHEAKLVREEGHFEISDEIEGVQTWIVDTEEVLCPVPSSLSKLQERSVELIGNDYDINEPLFDTDDLNILVTAINYAVSTLVSHSNITNDATFDWWKSKVIG